jgi:hypothetical protein
VGAAEIRPKSMIAFYFWRCCSRTVGVISQGSIANVGNSYGSECHLLRYMGRHRRRLDDEIRQVIGAEGIDWLDFHFDPSRPLWCDSERKSLDFIHPASLIHQKWSMFWPQSGNPINWDAVGRAKVGADAEWLLVEAKANLEELKSSCQAKNTGSIEKIRAALDETKRALGVSPQRDWLTTRYQFCNRVAALHFIVTNSEAAHLLFVYFTGDDGRGRRTCPQHEGEWGKALREQEAYVRLPSTRSLAAFTSCSSPIYTKRPSQHVARNERITVFGGKTKLARATLSTTS